MDRDGHVRFLPDVYGRDPAVIRGLAAKFSFRKRSVFRTKDEASQGDLGED